LGTAREAFTHSLVVAAGICAAVVLVTAVVAALLLRPSAGLGTAAAPSAAAENS
ncbi:MAG: hypothetical protein H0T68_05970, partial [Gemmatimonadales bacterium]|nr:hypothetical protein [Gemmatimonadales bacterium]